MLSDIILDPCAGGNNEVKNNQGVIECFHPMSYPTAIKNILGSDINIRTFDIRKDSLAEIKIDYLLVKLYWAPKIIITNPPFAQAVEVIQKALNDVAENGYVIMLLRLNFFGNKDRKPFFENVMPKYCFIHHQRISFIDKKNGDGYVEFDKEGKPKRGSTDSIEYCHMVFQKGYNENYTKTYVI